MQKDKFWKKLFPNKYKNPWSVKLFIVCLLILPLTIFFVFTIYGNFGGLIQAFQADPNGTGTPEWVGWDNFKTFFDWDMMFGKDKVWNIIANSFGYLFVFMFISVPISVVCSFFLYKKVPLSKAIVVILFMPNILPLSILAIYYNRLLATEGGVLAQALSFLLGTEFDWFTHGNLALYIYTVYFGFGYNAILIWGAMTRIPEEIVESANLDGANLFVEFWNITIPIIWPTMSMVLVLSWMVPFTVFNQPLMIAGETGNPNGSKGTITWSLYVMDIIKNRQNPYLGSALSILATLISLPSTLLIQKALEKVFPMVEV